MSEDMTDALRTYGAEVIDRADEVDPGNEEDWISMAIGWGIAKGMTPSEARDFAHEHGG